MWYTWNKNRFEKNLKNVNISHYQDLEWLRFVILQILMALMQCFMLVWMRDLQCSHNVLISSGRTKVQKGTEERYKNHWMLNQSSSFHNRWDWECSGWWGHRFPFIRELCFYSCPKQVKSSWCHIYMALPFKNNLQKCASAIEQV